MKTHEIARLESELGKKYGEKWDSANVYAKYIGTTVNETKSIQFCFCVFQLERMSHKIVQQEHVLI